MRSVFPEVASERLLIRLLAEDDRALYCGLYTDPETMRFIGQPLTWERAARSFRRAVAAAGRQPLESLFMALVDKVSREALGICSLQQIDPARRRAEAGIMLAAERRARGFAKEGLSALVGAALRALPIDEVWVQYAVGHRAAERLTESLDFVADAQLARSAGSAFRIWRVHRERWFRGARAPA